MLRPLVLVAALAAVTPPAATAATQPFLHAFVPGTDLFVSVEHGPGEPHSVGSYAVRLYRVVHRDLPYDLYLSGLLQERSGAVQELILADLAGDNVPEIVVVTRAAGSGGYLFADSYAIRAFRLRSLATVSWLPPDADPVASLRARLESTPDDVCGTARRATRTGSTSGGSLCSSSAPRIRLDSDGPRRNGPGNGNQRQRRSPARSPLPAGTRSQAPARRRRRAAP